MFKTLKHYLYAKNVLTSLEFSYIYKSNERIILPVIYVVYVYRLNIKANNLYTSTIEDFPHAERDIIIIWLDSYCRDSTKYNVGNVVPVMTRAKKALYIGGNLKHFLVKWVLYYLTIFLSFHTYLVFLSKLIIFI